jgi:hypothetical protein
LGVLVALLWTFCAATAAAGGAPALTWLGPVPIDQQAAPTAISCASTALCVAVDGEGHALVATDPGAGLGATWTRVDIDEKHPLTGVSCPSTALCVAIDGEGRAVASRDPGAGLGATWTQAVIDEKHPLTGVSCPSTALCVAVDGEGRALVATDPAAASWPSTNIDAPGNGLRAISCPSAALCVAVDRAGRALVSENPVAAAPSWSSRPVDPSLGLVSISCTAAGLCVAVDDAGNALASANAAARTPTWSATEIDTLAALTGISCTAAGLCVAVDDAGRAFASDDPTVASPGWPQTGPPASQYTGVACVPEGLCAAVDTGGQALLARVPAPAVATGPASEVTQSSATANGAVNPNDATLAECRFEYGLSIAYGQSAPCASLPAPGGAAGAARAQLTGLAPNTAYHYRVVARSAIGTTYGLDEAFKTQTPALVQPHPSISGTPAPGQRLSCHSGVSAAGVTLVYAWLRDLSPIRGGGGSTYVVGGADVSHHLQCQVTATNSGGSATATSAFVTVPAGGLGSISETAVGRARAAGAAVSVPLTCSRQAAGSCTIALRLSVVETLRGTTVIGLAARSAPRTRRTTVTVGANTVRLSPGQRRTVTVSLNATGRRLLARLRRLTVRLSVSGTVVGAIRASLESATLTLTSARISSHKASSHKRSAGGPPHHR